MRTIALPFCLYAAALCAQTTLTLEQARQVALANHPGTVDKQLFLDAGELRAKNVNAKWFPQVNVAAQGTYQSEVTEFDLSALGFPAIVISPDQYKAGLEVQQSLYDFGALKTLRDIERTKAQTQATQADVELFGLRERVEHLYGNILLQQENLRILRSRAIEIGARQSKVSSAVRNGVSLKSNEEVLRAESLTTQQRIVEAETALQELTASLSTLMGQPVDTSMTFVLPEAAANTAMGQRPELRLLALQRSSSELQAELLKRKNLPRLTTFGDGYYGRPGFNFLNNDFRPYGIVGVGLTWNISAYYTQGKELRANNIEQQLVDGRKRVFEMQQHIDLDKEEKEIAKLERLADLDSDIVKSKKFILASAASQLENGVITAQDYVTYQNAQDQAELDLQLHRIQAVMARIDHQRTQGN